MDSKWQEPEDVEAMVAARELERAQWVANLTKKSVPAPKAELSQREQNFAIREQLMKELQGEFFGDLISADEYNERKLNIWRRYPII